MEPPVSDHAAFQGDYVDLRFIKSRKCAAIVIEIPIEAAASFVAAFGAPSPATGVPVAIARLAAGKPTSEPAKAITGPVEKKPFSEFPLSKQAGMRCNDRGFWKFLDKRNPGMGIISPEDAADEVRAICLIDSRTELDIDSMAAERWRALDNEFVCWNRGY